ncbi:MAG: prenyltransferase/squalene oxidase repeat-containing protein [Cellulomonas sp.]
MRAVGPTVTATVSAAVRRLAQLAHRGGTWTDFWLDPGPSSSWVTAYVGLALAHAADDDRLHADVRALARRTAGRAADALLTTSRDAAWGWSPTVRPDADSTAWAVRLLGATARPVEARTWAFLDEHMGAHGVRTYAGSHAAGRWSDVMPEVTAVALMAQHEGGRLSRERLAERWVELFGADHGWSSHWWPGTAHPTALVLGAWQLAGRPEGHHALDVPTAGGPADLVRIAAALGVPTSLDGLLVGAQPNGQWTGSTVLLVPAAHAGHAPTRTIDARGAFTTATALDALLATRPWPSAPARPARPRTRDDRWDRLVADAAASQGVDGTTALDAFRALTRESLSAPSPWPAEQLSSLAAGLPVELSTQLGTHPDPALRLACDVGDPRLAPHRRARSGLAALARTADHLGLADAWHAARPVLTLLTDRDLPVPDGSRFWLWGGLALHADSSATLKAYLSLHGGDVPGWQARETAALAAAGVPGGSPVRDATGLLATAGWCQQIGVGLAADGRWGLKVYYELSGWRPELVREVLAVCRLPDEIASLTPEVPGVLRASMAARRRAGVSLRVDPATGAVGELTVTSAFPPPLVGRDELDARVLRWLATTGAETGPLTALLAAVAPTWRDAPPLDRRVSLFTRSLSRTRTATTVYVRPGLTPA